MVEQGSQEIDTNLSSRTPGLGAEWGLGRKGSPSRFPQTLGLPSSKGRQEGLAEASTLIGASALDPGLLCSPAVTNPSGREKGPRLQGTQSTNKRGLLVCVCLCQTDRPTPARRLASAQTNILGGRGKPPQSAKVVGPTSA